MSRSIEGVSFSSLYGPQNNSAQQTEKELSGATIRDFRVPNSKYYRQHIELIDEIRKTKDIVLPDNFTTKLRTGIETTKSLPGYAYRGLKGDPDCNFYEFLRLGNIPYAIGGPILAGVFLAGASNISAQSKLSATKIAKKMAVGVLLYYVASYLARKVIDAPVEWFRGVDLNHPYRDVVDLKPKHPSGTPERKTEIHKVFESIDFTRWDLMYKNKDIPESVNMFEEIAGKFGLDKEANDTDTALKPKIETLLITSRAWKYLLTVPFVMTALGIAKQKHWDNLGKGFGKALGIIINPKENLSADMRFKKLGILLNHHFGKPLVNSCKDLWKGNTKTAGVLGKIAILGAVLGTVIGNISILRQTKIDDSKYINTSHARGRLMS